MKLNSVATRPRCRMLQRGAELIGNKLPSSRSVLVALMMITGTSVAANTISVTSTNDGGAGSLRQAITSANSGDKITFALPPNSKITLTSGELLINKNLTINGPGRDELRVERSTASGTPEFRIFHITGNIDVTINDLTIYGGRLLTSNDPSNVGGGIRNVDGRLTITNCAIYLGVAFSGGGIANTGMLTMTNSFISNNAVFINGGAGIDNAGTATITDSAIYFNTAYGGGSAGIKNSGTLTITNSSIWGNEARNAGVDGGGGIGNTGTATIINSTISGNALGDGDTGGGILNDGGGSVTITNSTISDNSAAIGGGVANLNGTVTARNTIIAKNSAPTGPDYRNALTSQGYNLIGNNKDATITPTTGDQIGTPGSPKDPLLEPLNVNDGAKRTHALGSGSPAIEQGHSSGSHTDQRGLARPVDDPGLANVTGGDGSDIGAYEVQADVLPGCKSLNWVVNNNNDSGADSLRAIIANVCAGSTITFAQNVRGAITLTSGELVINKSLTINGPGATQLSVQRSTGAGTQEFRIVVIPDNFNVVISGLTLANGKMSGIFNPGGGILNGGTLTIKSSTILGNSAEFGGGGISNVGTVRISDSTISGNEAGSGGGISSTVGTVTITNSTISDNEAGSGGGIAGGTVDVTNSTISGNMAHSGNAGGISSFGTLTLTNSTISSNTATGSGGGVINSSGTVRARNTIIALNTAPTGPDVQGVLTSENFNLIGNSAGATISPAQFSDQIGTPGSPIDPLLGLLQGNGGPTRTHALLPGSRAIDKGHSSGWSVDQRGFIRPADRLDTANAPDGDGGDIGAFEVPAPAPTPTPTPTSTATPTVTPTPTAAPVTTLANISTRLRVETGDNVLIGGFIVTGTQPKKVIIRAIGTSLPIADRLENPTLELYGPNGLIESNDNWMDSPNKQAIIDSTIPPSSDLEAAIVQTLPADGTGYTAIVRGADSGTGIGVVEAYDLDTAANSRLANISTRGFVQTGDNVLIAGTIVTGPSSQNVIIRGIGPSLSVPGKMDNPILELRDSNGAVLQSNDNWMDSPNKQAIIDSGVPPANDLESAIVATLPGNNSSYTAILRGVDDTTGIAVVEVYTLQ